MPIHANEQPKILLLAMNWAWKLVQTILGHSLILVLFSLVKVFRISKLVFILFNLDFMFCTLFSPIFVI